MYIIPQDPSRYKAYPVKAGYVLAIVQMILGIASIVLQTIIMVNSPSDHFGGTGFYCGVMFVIAGGLGVGASKSSGGRCLVISTMVMSILAAVVAFGGQLSAASIGVVINSDDWRYYNGYYTKRRHDTSVVLLSILLVLAFIEGVIAIVQSAMCCRGCCCSTPAGQAVYYAVSPQQVVVGGGMGGQVAPSAPGPLVQLPNGQMAMIINSPCGPSMPVAGAVAPGGNAATAVAPAYQEKAGE